MDNSHNDFGPNSLNRIIEAAVKNNWELMAFSDLGGGLSYKYSEVAANVEKIHILFQAAGLTPGDKVAICGKNSSSWMVVFIACLAYGAVAVPILHEFKPESIHNLVNHSEAKLLFTDPAIWEKLSAGDIPNLKGVFFISEQGMPLCRDKALGKAHKDLNLLFGEKFPNNFTPGDVEYYRDSPDNLAVINYTSGSTGTPKGVMLPFRSIWSNIRYSIDDLDFLHPGDGMVNMLPLGHLYGMVIESLHPFVKGCHCFYITKAPSPAIIMKAFAQVRPKLVITVPLVIEKIIKAKVFPQLKKPAMKVLLAIPGLRTVVLKKIKNKLIEAFGGNLVEIIVGGAPINAEVEKFLYDIKFPITVGYGMTECGPLITYATPEESRPHTVGHIVDRMQVRIDSPDPENIPGNIYVRGDNVMKGYYKNEKATKEAFPNGDGWMNTGDMGTISHDGIIAIKGRSKTMILGPSGQNIYPEEIESLLNNMPFVNESLHLDDHGKLIALIHPDFEAAEKAGLDRKNLEATLDKEISLVNKQLEAYNRLSGLRIMEEEFEKTPKRSIKRFLYQP